MSPCFLDALFLYSLTVNNQVYFSSRFNLLCYYFEVERQFCQSLTAYFSIFYDTITRVMLSSTEDCFCYFFGINRTFLRKSPRIQCLQKTVYFEFYDYNGRKSLFFAIMQYYPMENIFLIFKNSNVTACGLSYPLKVKDLFFAAI